MKKIFLSVLALICCFGPGLAQAQGTIDLAPLSATNYVGESHTLTATLQCNGLAIVQGTVFFEVIVGPHAGTTGSDATDGNGQAIFSYTGQDTGMDTIRATAQIFCDNMTVTVTSGSVQKFWILPPAIEGTLVLAPETAQNCVGESHTVTATFTCRTNPVAGATVSFVITGPNAQTITGVTDASGQAILTYTGANIGTDTIQAAVETNCTNDNSTLTLTSNSVTKQWIDCAPPCTTVPPCTTTPPCTTEPPPCTTTTTVTCGGEGCTPGFWKWNKNDNNWPDQYAPDDKFADVFGEDVFKIGNYQLTLQEVLRLPGGGLNALGRHAVAALLNAASDGVNYKYTADEVIDKFQTVYPGTKADYEALKNEFAHYNEQDCPLSRIWDLFF